MINFQEIKIKQDEGYSLEELSLIYSVDFNVLCKEWKSRGWAVHKKIMSLEFLDESVPNQNEIDRMVRAKMMRTEERERRKKNINERLANNQFLAGINRKYA